METKTELIQKKKKGFQFEKINLETLLCILIVACPILDMTSFLFRNAFGTSFSPSTILRPIIPIVVLIYIFFKDKIKQKIVLGTALYGIYALLHIYLFTLVKTGSSYSGVIHEAQYIINYTFMILNLFLYLYIFTKKNTDKLKNSVLIAVGIYVISIFIAILTGTSSTTYIEGMGLKGWFESGNSISAILILSLFILLPRVKEKEKRPIIIGICILMGIFLTTLIGTRVGLFGFVLVLFVYVMVESIHTLLQKGKINKKLIIGGSIAIIFIMVLVGVVGSSTLQRRKHLKQIEGNIVDTQTGQEAHISGSLLKIKQSIETGSMEIGYMSDAQKQAVLDLYQIANQRNVVNNDMRTQQLIYNVCLVKEQANPALILFGNGYMAQYRELVLEMEIPAFLLNFGIFGFLLYFIPFLAIFIYACYFGIKHKKQLDSQYIMYVLGSGFTFALSFFSGYTFFNSSTMMIIIVIHTLLVNKIQNIKENG